MSLSYETSYISLKCIVYAIFAIAIFTRFASSQAPSRTPLPPAIIEQGKLNVISMSLFAYHQNSEIFHKNSKLHFCNVDLRFYYLTHTYQSKFSILSKLMSTIVTIRSSGKSVTGYSDIQHKVMICIYRHTRHM